MNEKTRETLYNAITDLPDERIEEALPPRKEPKNRGGRKALLPLAACLAAAALFGAWDHGLLGHGGGAGGGGTGEVYMSYAGPVFPLSALGDPDLTAERSVTFDFSPYAPHEETWETPEGQTEQSTAWKSQAVVTDSYTLTNRLDTEQTVTLLYPFAADLLSGQDLRPTLTVDGQAVETALHIGPTAEGYKDLFTGDPEAANAPWNLIDLMGWTSYRTILEAGYLDRTLAPVPALDQPVTVYRLTGCAPPAGYEGESFDLGVTYRPGARVLTWGFNAGFRDEETGAEGRGCVVSADGSDRTVPALIVLDGDLEDAEVRAYAPGRFETPLEGASWTLTREETTLAQVLPAIAGESLANSWRYGDGASLLSALTPAEYTDLAARSLSDLGVLTGDPAQLYGAGMLEELLNTSFSYMKEIGESFFDTLEGEGLSADDLSSKQRGIASYFNKLRKGTFDPSIITTTVNNHLENIEKWCPKTHPQRDAVLNVVEASLLQILKCAVEAQEKQWKIFQSANLTLRHLNQLRLLSSIEKKVREINETDKALAINEKVWKADEIPGSDYRGYFINNNGGKVTINTGVTLKGLTTEGNVSKVAPVYNGNRATFTMNGGSITNNRVGYDPDPGWSDKSVVQYNQDLYVTK